MDLLVYIIYLFILVFSFFILSLILWELEPAISEDVILSFVPWMVVGASLYVLYKMNVFPEIISPFFGSVTVYITTFIFAGIIWGITTATSHPDSAVSRVVHISGSIIGLIIIGTIFFISNFTNFRWSFVGFILSLILTAIIWGIIHIFRLFININIKTGKIELFVLFSHILDSISTAIGIDILGFKEQMFLSQIIMNETNLSLISIIPGKAWIFILIKIVLVIFILYIFTDYKTDNLNKRYILLGFIAALGFGPGTHNLILYSISI